jgi:hypothetical protein
MSDDWGDDDAWSSGGGGAATTAAGKTQVRADGGEGDERMCLYCLREREHVLMLSIVDAND